MATRPPLPTPTLSRRSRIVIATVVILILLAVAVSQLGSIYVNWLWFGSVGRHGVYSTIFWTKSGLFAGFGAAMAVVVAVNIVLAFRMRPEITQLSHEQASLERYRTVFENRRRLILGTVVVLVLVITGLDAQGRWQTWMLWRNGTSFGTQDPQFHKDISYYAFTYPFQRWILGFLFVAFLLSFLCAVIVHYVFGGIRIQGPGPKATRAARAHLSLLLGVFVLLKVVAYYFDRFGLLFSNRSVVTGAGYTDVNAVLPAKAILLFIAAICAVAFFANVFFRNFALPAIALVLLVLSSVLIGGAYPAIVQQFQVKPNQADKEATYIARNIDATSAAYGIDKVEPMPYRAATAVTRAVRSSISSPDNITVDNARLLDPNLLQPTFENQQRIQNIYQFAQKLDIDRYTVKGKTQDYVVGARELDPSKLSGNQRNWNNKHLVYTHGNGFVAAPANEVDARGAPVYTTGDLPTTGNIAVTQPRIYFGELFGDDYSIVGASGTGGAAEYDGTGKNTTYSGTGGVKVGGLLNRLVFAVKYKERNILLSGRITQGSKVLFVRDPRQRVQKIAPFLKVDGDPYPAVIGGRIKWVVDCYTTSDGYPYSERQTLGDVTKDAQTGRGTAGQPQQQFNYVRNSVKATVDAYDGTVNLYEFDGADPVLKTWEKSFPGLIQPTSDITPELRAHFRYPEDLFKIQRDLIATYHVKDAREYFNVQNFWSVPQDPTSNGGVQPPYYLLAAGANETTPTFLLTSVLTAYKRTNMAAYVTVSSDPGSYGKFTVLQLPGGVNVDGPVQAQSQFTSDTKVATGLLGLKSQTDTQIIRGNLLTLPVAGGLMYVQPIYAEGAGTSFPLLRKVTVSFGTSAGIGDTLDEAIDSMFSNDAGQGNDGTGSTPPNTTVPPPTTSPPTTAPSTTAPSTTAPGGGVSLPPDVVSAAADVQRAYTKSQRALAANDLRGFVAAQAELRQAVARLEAATRRAGGTVTPPSSTAPR